MLGCNFTFFFKKIPTSQGFRHILVNGRVQCYNSRFLHTYVDEDFVGAWIRLARRVARSQASFESEPCFEINSLMMLYVLLALLRSNDGVQAAVSLFASFGLAAVVDCTHRAATARVVLYLVQLHDARWG